MHRMIFVDNADQVDRCRENNVLYANTSVEEWDPYKDSERNDPTKYTLYSRHMELRQKIDMDPAKGYTTTIVDHGANPGLVSHFTKYASLSVVPLNAPILNRLCINAPILNRI